jgi:hypothetical protein
MVIEDMVTEAKLEQFSLVERARSTIIMTCEKITRLKENQKLWVMKLCNSTPIELKMKWHECK